MFYIFASSFAVGFSGAMMPGSLLTYTIRQALSNGPRAGFVIIFGHAILEISLLFLIFLGFDLFLQSEGAQIGIGLLGGLFLAKMGLDMILGAARNQINVTMEQGGANDRSMVLSGILISAANPYFLLWWAVIGLGFVMKSFELFGYLGVILFFLGHILSDLTWYVFVSTLVGKTRRFLNQKTYRTLIMVLGSMLIFFGGTFLYGAAVKLLI